MKKTILALAAASLIAGSPLAFAQGASSNAPGQKMQEKGSKMGSPGASGYSPGHKMQQKGAKSNSPGASGYAPGQSTTGSATKSDQSDTLKNK